MLSPTYSVISFLLRVIDVTATDVSLEVDEEPLIILLDDVVIAEAAANVPSSEEVAANDVLDVLPDKDAGRLPFAAPSIDTTANDPTATTNTAALAIVIAFPLLVETKSVSRSPIVLKNDFIDFTLRS